MTIAHRCRLPFVWLAFFPPTVFVSMLARGASSCWTEVLYAVS